MGRSRPTSQRRVGAVSKKRAREHFQRAIDELAAAVEYGELHAATDPAQLLLSAAATIRDLRERIASTTINTTTIVIPGEKESDQ